ncbi:hypothetical protein AAZX31_08G347900 [Glycine max]|uniref:Defensin-like protein n=2 Tax=Glycine subgen. Soja TaxID=1462606 RepID=I1KZD5_SOYBN|nr:hypothetical protein JHK87_023436 [Glycine soja]KAG5017954.1 hypothetical protein JHK85_024090 [Glycine max]KAG5027635.1 hypothetical protein JHK86_023549 [Glycine max]KAG5138757.1 hypothetical protein JHK82_023488 [Glycine max]KAH1054705.1 hypothetical protein GYH30_023467 [Glycine max]
MAFGVNHSFLFGILFAALVLTPGQANVDVDPPGLICLRGSCVGNTQCALLCVGNGHVKGGSCVGLIPGLILCCCNN